MTEIVNGLDSFYPFNKTTESILSLTRATPSLIILRLKSQAPVVRKADSVVHWINNYPLDSAIGFVILILWIVIYPVDSAIYLLNNRGLDVNFVRAPKKANSSLNYGSEVEKSTVLLI